MMNRSELLDNIEKLNDKATREAERKNGEAKKRSGSRGLEKLLQSLYDNHPLNEGR